MSEHKQVDQLRRELADALCVAQGLPVPRTGLHKMLHSLLSTAFAGLDDDSGIDRAVACTIALHALREWRTMAGLGEQAVSVASPV
jgi:hypothetical protein